MKQIIFLLFCSVSYNSDGVPVPFFIITLILITLSIVIDCFSFRTCYIYGVLEVI